MTGLELQYRLLMRAYPPNHRARHEDEIVATLLDVAPYGQRRPRIREATAMVKAGVECRAEQPDSELASGLRLAGIGALVATFIVSTMAIVVAVQMPLSEGLVPVMAWLAVLAGSAFAVWSASAYRVVPAATVALIMVAAGPSIMGLRRSTLVPAAIILLLSACGLPARQSLRLGAATVGVVLGLVQGSLLVTSSNQVFLSSDPWVYNARWYIVSNVVTFSSPFAFLACLTLAIAAGFWRPRYAIAAAVLATPFAMFSTLIPRSPFLSIVGPQLATILSTVTAVVVLGVIVKASGLGRRGMHRAG